MRLFPRYHASKEKYIASFMKRLRQLRSLSLYFCIPAISAVTPLVVLPALTSIYGPNGLTAIGIGQSLGAAAGVIGELGWSVVGSQRIARATESERSRLYQSAFATKLTALSLIVPIFALLAFFISPTHKLAAAAIAVGAGMMAMSPGWFLVGLNKPLLILVVEAIPRLVMSVACSFLLLHGWTLGIYGISIVAAVTATWLLTATLTGQSFWPRRESFTGGVIEVRAQLPLTLGRVVSVLYTSLPVTIVAIVSPSSTAAFIAADRLMRMALSLLGGIPSRLQSWVGSCDGQERLSRSRKSLMANLMLGFLSAVGFTCLAPFVAPFVFASVVGVSFETAALCGLVILAICFSRGFGLSLVAEGKANWIAVANIAAAIIGVMMVFHLCRGWGVAGAIVGGLCAEVVGLSVQAFILFRRRRRKLATN